MIADGYTAAALACSEITGIGQASVGPIGG
jgi:hypothetical protein